MSRFVTRLLGRPSSVGPTPAPRNRRSQTRSGDRTVCFRSISAVSPNRVTGNHSSHRSRGREVERQMILMYTSPGFDTAKGTEIPSVSVGFSSGHSALASGGCPTTAPSTQIISRTSVPRVPLSISLSTDTHAMCGSAHASRKYRCIAITRAMPPVMAPKIATHSMPVILGGAR